MFFFSCMRFDDASIVIQQVKALNVSARIYMV